MFAFLMLFFSKKLIFPSIWQLDPHSFLTVFTHLYGMKNIWHRNYSMNRTFKSALKLPPYSTVIQYRTTSYNESLGLTARYKCVRKYRLSVSSLLESCDDQFTIGFIVAEPHQILVTAYSCDNEPGIKACVERRL